MLHSVVMKQHINKNDLTKGLQFARFSFVLLALFSLVTPLSSALSRAPLSYLPFLLTGVFLFGQLLCYKGGNGIGKLWILGSMACQVFGVLLAFIPKLKLLQILSVFGSYGFVLAGLITVVFPLLSFPFFLVYLRILSQEFGLDELAGHFTRLIFVPILAILVLFGCVVFLSGALALLGPLSVLVLGLVMVISYSGAMAKLIQGLD